MAAKRDVLHDALKLLDYCRWTWLTPLIGVLLICGLAWGMAARVPSIPDPGVRVKVDVFNAQAADAQALLNKRSAELKAEAQKLAADQAALDLKIEQAGQIVAKRQEQMNQVWQFLGAAATNAVAGQPFNPLALVTSLIGIAGGLATVGGTVLDPKRRTSLKKQAATPSV